MNITWHINSNLPKEEPNQSNQAEYCSSQLLAGASDDGTYIFDAVYLTKQNQFILTIMIINEKFGFIEDEKNIYLNTRQELIQKVAEFKHNPIKLFSKTE